VPVLCAIAHRSYAALLGATAAGCLVPDALRLHSPTHIALAAAVCTCMARGGCQSIWLVWWFHKCGTGKAACTTGAAAYCATLAVPHLVSVTCEERHGATTGAVCSVLVSCHMHGGGEDGSA
jgi:hypothetical protein